MRSTVAPFAWRRPVPKQCPDREKKGEKKKKLRERERKLPKNAGLLLLLLLIQLLLLLPRFWQNANGLNFKAFCGQAKRFRGTKNLHSLHNLAVFPA